MVSGPVPGQSQVAPGRVSGLGVTVTVVASLYLKENVALLDLRTAG